VILTSSFESGEVPEDWKTAVIVPIYKKKGLLSDPTNYRPVSLTSVPCKIMECLIIDNLVEFTESNNILTKHQHGFMQHRSCLTNLLEALEAWTEALDEGLGVDVLFLDCRKAFDSVAYKKLIDELQTFGIQSNMLRWIEQFLTARTMRVGVRGSFSDFSAEYGTTGVSVGPCCFCYSSSSVIFRMDCWQPQDVRIHYQAEDNPEIGDRQCHSSD